VQNCGVRGGT